MERKQLGKISNVEFGMGGYQDVCIGVSFTLEGKSWGVSDFWGCWALKWDQHCEWTEKDRINDLGNIVLKIATLLEDAKVKGVSDLKNVPVEATFEDNKLKSWRILKEVL